VGAARHSTTATVEASLACYRCSWRGEISNLYSCPACGSSLLVTFAGTYEPSNATADEAIWQYRGFLPVPADAEPVTLGEGDTPLLQARRLNPSGGLLLKNETVNPTGSFKDRPVAVAATVARVLGLSGLICASTGNTGVAVAAYAARAGLPAACVVPETTPAAKMIQIEAVGASIVRVRGNYSDAYALARAAAESYGWANLTSTYVNPYMLEGDKTVAYELFKQLGERVPDWVLVPVGAGPLLAAIHKGFKELGVPGPRMVGVQAAGCAPVVRAFESGTKEVHEWEDSLQTTASSIADPLRGYPEDGTRTLSVVRESGGKAVAVSEEETRQATLDLARSEGLLVESGTAVAVAAYRKLVARELIHPGETTVIVLTGHGLKDPDALRFALGTNNEATVIDPGDVEALGAALEVYG
jgi:threonine synthase